MKKMFMMAAAGVLAVSLTACGGNQKSATESVNAGAEKTEAQKTEASQEKKETEGKAEEKHMTMTWWGNQVRNERTELSICIQRRIRGLPLTVSRQSGMITG